MPKGIYKRIKNPIDNLKGGWKGKNRPPFSEDWKKNIGKSSKGRHPIKEFKKGNIKSRNAYKFPSGERHPNWQGGKSFEPYTVDWKITLKRSIRERDHYICGLCGLPQEEEALSVHHIDYNKKNCNPDNLISLHRKCHIKTNKNRDKWKLFFDERIPKKK